MAPAPRPAMVHAVEDEPLVALPAALLQRDLSSHLAAPFLSDPMQGAIWAFEA